MSEEWEERVGGVVVTNPHVAAIAGSVGLNFIMLALTANAHAVLAIITVAPASTRLTMEELPWPLFSDR